jgi:probable HAF family extracellular repeat protein
MHRTDLRNLLSSRSVRPSPLPHYAFPTAQGANSIALGINNKGEVVGYSFQGEDYQAFVYSSWDQPLTDVGFDILCLPARTSWTLEQTLLVSPGPQTWLGIGKSTSKFKHGPGLKRGKGTIHSPGATALECCGRRPPRFVP